MGEPGRLDSSRQRHEDAEGDETPHLDSKLSRVSGWNMTAVRMFGRGTETRHRE